MHKKNKKGLAMTEKEMYRAIIQVAELARSLHIITEQIPRGFHNASHNKHYRLFLTF